MSMSIMKAWKERGWPPITFAESGSEAADSAHRDSSDSIVAEAKFSTQRRSND